MKRKAEPAVPRAALKAQINTLQQLCGALVARLGGHVELNAREIDGHEGDRMEVAMGPDGCVLHLHRRVRIVSALN